MTDPIADMLTRIRNAVHKRHDVVEVPSSKIKLALAGIFKQEGFIRDFHTMDYKNQGKILINLKYVGDKVPTIVGLQRVSKPGRRMYLSYKDIKPYLSGTGVTVFSTPKGILTDQAAREQKVGGEVLFNIW